MRGRRRAKLCICCRSCSTNSGTRSAFVRPSVRLTVPFAAPYYFVSAAFEVREFHDALTALPGPDEADVDAFPQTSRFEKDGRCWGGDVKRITDVAGWVRR